MKNENKGKKKQPAKAKDAPVPAKKQAVVEKSSPQLARVEQPFGCNPPEVHCPICGAPVAEIGADGADLRPCIHAAFVYSSCAGEFVFESGDFSNRTMDMDPDDLDFSEPQKTLSKLGYGNSMLAIQITYGGMACGPVWFTAVYGFDYGTLTAE
jgi:hypothetical protein